MHLSSIVFELLTSANVAGGGALRQSYTDLQNVDLT